MKLRLKQLRKERNLNQEEFAEILGTARSTVSLYESGRRTLNSETITKICSFFGVSVDYLYCRTDNRNSVTAAPGFDIDMTLLNNDGCVLLAEFYNFLLGNEKYSR